MSAGPRSTAGPASLSTAGDVARYLAVIGRRNKEYGNLTDKLRAIKARGDRLSEQEWTERADLILKRQEVKQAFIESKRACRSLLELLRAGGDRNAATLREAELKALQEEFRAIDADFKELGFLQDREALLGRSSEESGGREVVQAKRATNAELLDGAVELHDRTKENLVSGLAQINITHQVGAEAAATLAEDREKMTRISGGLDEVQSELRMSQALLVRFAKRLYTDKVIIAFAFLLVAGIVTIIIYATVNKNQTTFNVPDTVKPPTSLPSSR